MSLIGIVQEVCLGCGLGLGFEDFGVLVGSEVQDGNVCFLGVVVYVGFFGGVCVLCEWFVLIWIDLVEVLKISLIENFVCFEVYGYWF